MLIPEQIIELTYFSESSSLGLYSYTDTSNQWCVPKNLQSGLWR